MKEVVEIVADYFNLHSKKVFSDSRERKIIKCRQISIYIIRSLSSLTMQEIGDFFKRDHSSITHTIKAVSHDIDTDWMFKMEVNLLKARCEKRNIPFRIKKKYCKPMIYEFN